MAGKFMKIKKIILPVMAAVILTSQLAGCATMTSTEMMDMLNQGQDIEISIAMPDYEISSIGDIQEYKDIQLDQLQTYTVGGFRQDFDKLFGIEPVEFTNFSSKLGCIYVNKLGQQDGNTSFKDSLRNKVFMEKYFNTDGVQTELSKLAELAYTDVDTESSNAILASLNAYYNLFSDSLYQDDTYFNASQSITRGDFYSFVYRAGNGVNDLLKTEGDFKNKVGIQDRSALYASQIDECAWLNADNEGLRAENYKGSITRAEAVYMLMNLYFGDELKGVDVSAIKLDDAKDGGDFLEDTDPDKKESNILYSVDKKTKEQTLAKGWQLGVLSKMLKDSEGNVHTDIFKALGLANEMGIIDTETRYNEPISKAEAIDLFIKTMEALNNRDGYLTEVANGDTSMYIFTPDEQVPVEDEPVLDWEEPPVTTTYNAAADLNNDGHVDKSEWEEWIKNNPADINQDLHVTDEERAEYNKPAETSKPSQPSKPAQPSGSQQPTKPVETPPPAPETPSDTSGDSENSDFGGSLDDMLNWGSDDPGPEGSNENFQQDFDPVQ